MEYFIKFEGHSVHGVTQAEENVLKGTWESIVRMRVWHGEKDNKSTKNVRCKVSRARIRGLAPLEMRKEQSTKEEGRSL